MLKRNIMISLIIIIFTIIIGQFLKRGILDYGILAINSTDDMKKIEFEFEAVLNEHDCDSFNYYKDDYVKELDDAEYIAIVKPTGKVEQRNGLLRQEVTVKKIIRGSNSLQGDTIFLQGTDGISFYFKSIVKETDNLNAQIEPKNIMTNDENITDINNIYFIGIRNVMEADSEYVAFLNYREENANKNLKQNKFYDIYGSFGYLKLNVEDNNDVIELNKKYKLSELKNNEFFSSSTDTLEAIYIIKKLILEKYE